MIKCDKGHCKIIGSPMELLTQYSAITHTIHDMLCKELPEHIATEILVQTANCGISEESNKFFSNPKEVKK